MKLYKSLFMTVLAAVAFTSCSDEGYWEKGEIEGTRYSFAQASSNYSLTASDVMTEAVVTVYRSSKEGETTIPLTVAIDSAHMAVLSVPNSAVTFADGSDVAEVLVNVDMSAMAIGAKYQATFALDVDSAAYSVSGPMTHTFSIVLNYNWVPAGKGVYASSWDGSQFGITFEKVEGYSDENGYQLYRIPNLYANGYHLEFYTDAAGNAVAAAYGSIPLGISDGGSPVYIYNDYVNYADYCSFTNNENLYVLNALWRIGSSLYTGCAEQFLWQEGWPGATE